MKNIRCIFCNKSSNQVVIEENGYEGRKCPKCNLIYVSPRPSFSQIQNLYSHDQAHISAESHISASFSKRLYAKHNLRIMKRFIKSGSILEIGAGAGYFLDEARGEGFKVYSIELNSIHADFIRSKLGIPCEESPLDASSFDGKKFDIIYHCDVLSHFYDPIAEFKKINSALRGNGIIVFETGNFGDVKKRYYRLFEKFQYPDHLFFFGENSLKELLRLTGFKFIRIYRYSILPQVLIFRMLRRAIDFIRSQEENKNVGGNSITTVLYPSVKRFSFQKLVRDIYSYFFYVIRYKIGYVMPKKGRPQTVIVIAQKASDLLSSLQ